MILSSNTFYIILFLSTIVYLFTICIFLLYFLSKYNNIYIQDKPNKSLKNIFKIYPQYAYSINCLFLLIAYLFKILIFINSSFWFNHLFLGYFQIKYISYLTIYFLIFWISILNKEKIISIDFFEYLIVCLLMWLWLLLIALSNSLYIFFFFIELLTITLIFLFSLSYFINNESNLFFNIDTSLNLNKNKPLIFINSILLFFWMSAIASLGLFYILLIIGFKFLTLEWSLLVIIFNYKLTFMNFYLFIKISLVWLLLLICFFIKLGISPFFFWKPFFFKGLNFLSLYVYIVFYYINLIIVFIYLFLLVILDIFFTFTFINLIIILLSILIFLFSFLSTVQFKVFLGYSSILNTILIFFIIFFMPIYFIF